MEQKLDILKVRNLVKEKRVRKRIPDECACEVCGSTKEEGKLRRFNDYIVCEKHYDQLNKYGKITDTSKRKHKKPLEKCSICGDLKMASFEGTPYCRKHYIQITRHGAIRDRTIYDANEYVIHENYVEIKCFDKNGNYKASTKVDLEFLPDIKKHKIYIRKSGIKEYAAFSGIENEEGSGKKYFVHRYIMHLHDKKYNIDEVVDHINGDSLDNRISNLRVCTQKENSYNNRGTKLNQKIKGVNWLKVNKKWTARIMHNYKNIHLGNYFTYAEAVLARIKKEQELFGKYGPNKDLYYIINHPSPIEELNKILEIPSIEGA